MHAEQVAEMHARRDLLGVLSSKALGQVVLPPLK
jgi:hypothetical protein